MLTNSFHAVLVLTMSINRTLLAAFHSVANAGSFTAAAHEKSVTQSTLSVQVGQLEKTYGCKLFLRHGRSIALTETGRELYNLTRQQFDAEQEAEALLSGKSAVQLVISEWEQLARCWLLNISKRSSVLFH